MDPSTMATADSAAATVTPIATITTAIATATAITTTNPSSDRPPLHAPLLTAILSPVALAEKTKGRPSSSSSSSSSLSSSWVDHEDGGGGKRASTIITIPPAGDEGAATHVTHVTTPVKGKSNSKYFLHPASSVVAADNDDGREQQFDEVLVQLNNIHKTYLLGIEGVPALR